MVFQTLPPVTQNFNENFLVKSLFIGSKGSCTTAETLRRKRKGFPCHITLILNSSFLPTSCTALWFMWTGIIGWGCKVVQSRRALIAPGSEVDAWILKLFKDIVLKQFQMGKISISGFSNSQSAIWWIWSWELCKLWLNDDGEENEFSENLKGFYIFLVL